MHWNYLTDIREARCAAAYHGTTVSVRPLSTRIESTTPQESLLAHTGTSHTQNGEPRFATKARVMPIGSSHHGCGIREQNFGGARRFGYVSGGVVTTDRGFYEPKKRTLFINMLAWLKRGYGEFSCLCCASPGPKWTSSVKTTRKQKGTSEYSEKKTVLGFWYY